MTQPGSIVAPQPGWWARTERVGTDTAAGFGWAANATGATAHLGSTPTTYSWAGSATGVKPSLATPKSFNSSSTNSVTIGSHNVGDIIVIFTSNVVDATALVSPAASGTVPAWVSIDNTAGANGCASATAYFVATATNHTSGTWTNANNMIAAVLRGQGPTPIGGHAEAGSNATGSATAPSVTMSRTDGTSVLLHFFGFTTLTTWSAAPTGYTQRVGGASTAVCCDTKDSTTADGAVTQTNSASTAAYRGATVEIRSY